MRYFLILMTINFSAVTATAQSKKDEEQIKKVVQAFQKDFNDGSFKNAINYATIDWVHINPLGGIDTGRDSVLKVVRAAHQTFLKDVKMKIENMETRFLSATSALVVAVHTIDDFTTPDGVQHKNERHIKTYVLVNQNGKWLLSLDQNTIRPNSL